MTDPAVDVIIPAYNCGQTIRSAVTSIQDQTIRGIRIIVVNDGSTDTTMAILEQMAQADPRLVVISQPNGGIVDALNAGLALCTADIVARHDADDLSSPDRFERQLAFLRDHPECVAVSGAVIHINERGTALGPPFRLRSPDLANPNTYPQHEPYLVHPFLMMRRAAVEAIGQYRYAFHAEDVDLYWRLQEQGRLVNLPDVVGCYRIHAESITGLSIVNGRISAVNSQRAGISAMRRRSGRPDIEFPKTALAEYQKARSLEGMIRIGSRGLDSDEARRLAVAGCAKLLELAGYRPYELEIEDCDLIQEVMLPELSRMSSVDRHHCLRMLSGTAARMIATGRLGSALRLVRAKSYGAVAAKLAMRAAMPGSVRRRIRRMLGRNQYVK